MAREFNIYIEGFDKVQQRFRDMPRRLRSEINAELVDGVQEIVQRAKQNAPADQGLLRNSISYYKEGQLDYAVVVGVDYAEFVEFGTRNKRRVPPELEKIASVHRNTGTPGNAWNAISEWCRRKGIDPKLWYPIYRSVMAKGIDPHPFFFPAIESVRPKLVNNLKSIAKRL